MKYLTHIFIAGLMTLVVGCVIVMKTILDDWEVRTCQKPKK